MIDRARDCGRQILAALLRHELRLTTMRYGVLVSFCVDALFSAATGGPTGELSSNTSPDTRNLMGSPISMYKSCFSPSSNGYSHTQACSASSKRDGCCKTVGGMRMSSKKPSVTVRRDAKFRAVDSVSRKIDMIHLICPTQATLHWTRARSQVDDGRDGVHSSHSPCTPSRLQLRILPVITSPTFGRKTMY